MKEPVDHIERPRLPWRSASEPSITECGYVADKVQSISRDEFFRRLKDYGVQRKGHRLHDELLAIVQLIEAHPKQFQTLLERQEWIHRKAGRSQTS